LFWKNNISNVKLKKKKKNNRTEKEKKELKVEKIEGKKWRFERLMRTFVGRSCLDVSTQECKLTDEYK